MSASFMPHFTLSQMKFTFLGDCHSESVKYFHDHMKDAKMSG